jgi:hypothetical protein
MQYDLDPRLLPASGASVQCTRCTFVFTAMPSGEVLVPAQGQAPSASRTPVGTSTRVFGSPYVASPSQAGPTPQTTQIFGAVKAPAAASQGTPAAGTFLPSPGKTQVFGAVSAPASSPAPAPSPSPSTTQVFGAAAVAARASSPTSTQVFGAVSVPPAPPAATTTQVFGAVSVPPARPAPAPGSTTQVFGAVAVAEKASAPPAMQVFAEVSAPAQLPAAATTQVFGSADVQAARKAKEAVASPPARELGVVSWLVEPGPAPASPAPRVVTAERQASVPSGPSVELPAEEPVPLPDPAHAHAPAPPRWPAEERVEPQPQSRRSAAVELPPELMLPERSRSVRSAPEPAPSGGGKERPFIVLAAVVALGLTAWLSYPVWRNQGSGMPVEAVSAKDDAVSMLRRDDAASRSEAIDKLSVLAARYPKFTEAQAELTVGLALQLDDVNVELEWIHLEQVRLQKEIDQLTLAKAPADWSGQVSLRKRELITLTEQRQPLDTTAKNLTKDLSQVLAVIRAAPETEPAADVVARVKALAIYEGINGSPQALALAERLRKLEPSAHWSVIALAEYGLHTQEPAAALEQVPEALAQLRTSDQTFLRAYMLDARLALRRGDGASARTLLDAVLALNPNHALARTLQKWAAAMPTTP